MGSSQWPQLPESWSALASEFTQPYMLALQEFLQQEIALGKLIYPPQEQRFTALELTPLSQVKVVILGQDPYHGAGQAQGLSFSVAKGVPVPPSLKNIFQEQHQDLGLVQPGQGCLKAWAQQGVLLLNRVLSVEAGLANSHQGRGWEEFSAAILQLVNQLPGVVFMLWGKAAGQQARFLDASRHLILTAAHPSPLSAYRGFFGCQHFSKANVWLAAQGQEPINWQLAAS